MPNMFPIDGKSYIKILNSKYRQLHNALNKYEHPLLSKSKCTENHEIVCSLWERSVGSIIVNMMCVGVVDKCINGIASAIVRVSQKKLC